MPKKPIPSLIGCTVRCILFDLGDTLWFRKNLAIWHHLKNTSNARAATLLRQSIASTSLPTISDTALGQLLHDAMDEQIRSFIRQNPTHEPDFSHIIVQVLQQWGVNGVSRASAAAIFEALRVRIPESRSLFDDVLSTLTSLQQRGFQLGIVTNRHWGGTLFQEDLQKMGLLSFFNPRHIAVSADLGIRKPNPAIFLHALKALGIPPTEAVMVGDSLSADIAGGKRLNIYTVWKPNIVVCSQARRIAAGVTVAETTTPTHSNDQAGVRSDNVLDEPRITYDDYILAHMQSRSGKWDQHVQSHIKPDLIIENLSELLDIFTEVGVQ